MRNYAMLRESVKSINIEISPWTMNELRNKNVTSIRQLLYQMYIGLKKHEQQRDAPFNGPVVYSTIESISRPGSKETIDQLLKYYFCLVTSIPIIIDFTFTLSHLSNELSFFLFIVNIRNSMIFYGDTV